MASTSNSQTSSESLESLDILKFGVQLDFSIVFDHIKMSLHKFDMLDIYNQLDVWAFNRKLDDEHVQSLYNAILQHKAGHFMGTIKMIKDDNNVFKVIDGQHRLQALKTYYDNHVNNPLHISIYVEIYHLHSLDDEIVFELFKIANNNLNVKAEDHVNMFFVDLVNALMRDSELCQGIIDKNDGKVNKPCMSKKEVYEKLKYNMKLQDVQLPIDEVVNRIKRINNAIGRIIINTNITVNNARAINKHFYLNLKSQMYCPERWILWIGDDKKIQNLENHK